MQPWLVTLFVILFGGLGLPLPNVPGLPGPTPTPTTTSTTSTTIPGGPTTTTTFNPNPGTTSGVYSTKSFTNSSGTRSYGLYIPSGYKVGTPMPLVVGLHGCVGSALDFVNQSGLNSVAEVNKFIVAYPEQTSAANNLKCWNWYTTAGQQRGSGEASIIAGITQQVKQDYSVNNSRVFTLGLSAGGAMAVNMGVLYPDVFAGVGVGSGLTWKAGAGGLSGYPAMTAEQSGQQIHISQGANSRTVPVYIFHGLQDKTVVPKNADDLAVSWIAANDLADDGSRNNSVPANPVSTVFGTSSGDTFTTATYNDRNGQELIQVVKVTNMGHAWSGRSGAAYTYPAGPDETSLMYSFLSRHPKP